MNEMIDIRSDMGDWHLSINEILYKKRLD